MNTRPVVNEFVRFGIVGIAATALHYGIYYLLQPYINVNIAYSIGYILSFIANFYLTALFTFGKKPSWKKAFGFLFYFRDKTLLEKVNGNGRSTYSQLLAAYGSTQFILVYRNRQSMGTRSDICHCNSYQLFISPIGI